MLTFGPITDATALEGHDTQLKVVVRFLLGDDATLEACLEEIGEPIRHGVMADSAGHRWDVFALTDAALMFRAGTLEIVGHAIQHGFIAKDRDLWVQLDALPPEVFDEEFLLSQLDLSIEPEEGIDAEADFGWYASLLEDL